MAKVMYLLEYVSFVEKKNLSKLNLEWVLGYSHSAALVRCREKKVLPLGLICFYTPISARCWFGVVFGREWTGAVHVQSTSTSRSL